MTTSQAPTTELVPIADRYLYLEYYRVLSVICLSAAFAAWPSQFGLKAVGFAGTSAVYLALAGMSHRAWQLERARAISIFGIMLLIDGLYLAVVTYGSAGLGTPFQYLLLAHLVTVTLLASFRTGLKLAVWHALLLAAAFRLQSAGILHPFPFRVSSESSTTLWISIGLALAVTLATSTFAAVNERELRRRIFDLHALSRLAWKLEASLTPEQVGQALVETLRDDFGLARVALMTGQSDQLKLLSGYGLMETSTTTAGPELDRLRREVLNRNETVLVKHLDGSKEPWLAAVLPDATNLLACPLHANGETIGVLVAEHGVRRGSRVERRLVSVIESCVSHAALALSGAWLLERSRAWAGTDPLTGIGNRRTFDDRLKRELSRATDGGTTLGCLMFDIDDFKLVNDRYGHAAGDDVIRAVANAAVAHCRPSDTVARYGGEEFVILLPGISDEVEAGDTAERIRQFISGMTGEGEIAVSVSVGVAVYPQTVTESETIVQVADRALYQAKRSGRNRVVIASRAKEHCVVGTPPHAVTTTEVAELSL